MPLWGLGAEYKAAVAKKGFKVSDLSSLTSGFILNNVAFIAFLGFLAIVYIANAHYAEGNVRNIQLLQQEVRDLRWQLRTTQSENMYNSKQAQISDQIREEGQNLQRGQAKKIVISEE